jgi:hypothetical protein
MIQWSHYYQQHKDKLPLNEIVRSYNFLLLKEQQEFILRQQSHRRPGGRYILQEDGSYILQQDGSRIIW